MKKTCLTILLFFQAAFAPNLHAMPQRAADPNCNIDLLSVIPVWREPHKMRFKRIGAVNGVLVNSIAEFFKKKKRFPLEFELIAALKKAVTPDDFNDVKGGRASENLLATIVRHGLKSYFQMEGAAANMNELYALSVKELTEVYGPFRIKVADHMAKFFARRLRFPSNEDLANEFGLVSEHMSVVMGDRADFENFVRQNSGVQITKARELLVKILINDMKQTDRPTRLRTRSTTPEMQDLFDSIKSLRGAQELRSDVLEGILTVEQFAGVVTSLFPGGVAELEKLAREMQPASFQGHIDVKYFGIERQKQLIAALEKSRGALVSTYSAGFPIEERQLEAMLAYAEDRDFVIVLQPEMGILDGVDPRFFDHERVFLLTHTIENSALKLWNIPVGPKQINPLASLDFTRQVRTGQTVVIGSPQQVMMDLPRVGSDLADTSIWSPGSVSIGTYPYRLPIQGRTSYLAEGRHLNGFLVLEKANANAGALGLGAKNSWHARNVEVRLSKDKFGADEAYFNDHGNLYGATKKGIVKMKEGAQVLVLGDLHDHVTLQSILPHIAEYIRSNPQLEKLVLHDPLDGYSHNRHERDRFMGLLKKLRGGELDMLGEYLNLVQTVNAFLLLNPNLEVIMVDSNHSYWGTHLVEQHDPVQNVVNGEFLAELRLAMTRKANPFRDPLHYVFDKEGRELYLSRLSENELRQTEGSTVRLVDPDRVRVLKYGSILSVGSSEYPVNIHLHGHLGINGGRPSARAHAVGAGSSVMGDSHRREIRLDFMNVGTITPKKLGYNDGGYSSWAQGWGLIYKDGTKQLDSYSEALDAYRQDADQPVLPAEEFFADDKLQVLPNPNEIFDEKYKHDQYTKGPVIP